MKMTKKSSLIAVLLLAVSVNVCGSMPYQLPKNNLRNQVGLNTVNPDDILLRMKNAISMAPSIQHAKSNIMSLFPIRNEYRAAMQNPQIYEPLLKLLQDKYRYDRLTTASYLDQDLARRLASE